MSDLRDRLAAVLAASQKATGLPWATFYGIHGDPVVTQQAKPRTGTIADLLLDPGPLGGVAAVGTGPADYGRSNAEYIAMACNEAPRLAAALLNVLEVIEETKGVPGIRNVFERDLLAAIHAAEL